MPMQCPAALRVPILLVAFLTFTTGCRDEGIELPPIVPDYAGQAVLYPGTVVARDLSTPDLSTSIRFYRDLLGWNFRPVDKVDAAVAEVEGKTVAVFFEKKTGEGPRTPALWIPAFSVEALDPAIARFRSQGGELLSGRLELTGRGAMVFLRDPEGAVFSVLVSSTGDPVPGAQSNLPWNGALLATEDFAASRAIYEHTLGLRFQNVERTESGGRYAEILAGTHRIGWIASSLFENISGAWLPILEVADIDAMAEQVQSLGGLVLIRSTAQAPAQTLLIQDPAGALLILKQSDPVSQ